MYKTLIKKIQDLQIKKDQTNEQLAVVEIQSEIEKYQKEADKIRNKFPEKFFEKNN